MRRKQFGELERLVTPKLLDVAQGVAKEELQRKEWLRTMAKLNHRTYEQVRVAILEFLDTDIFNISAEYCVSFLDPMIDSWDIVHNCQLIIPYGLADHATGFATVPFAEVLAAME